MNEDKDLLHCRYFWSCIIYVFYAFGFVLIDIQSDVWSMSQINRIYVWLGVVHLINAQQYAWVALQDHRWNEMWLVPDYLNIIGSVLYMWSATLYKDEALNEYDRGGHKFGQFNESYYVIRNLELAASIIEVFAAIGWVVAWYASYSDTFYPEEGFVDSFCLSVCCAEAKAKGGNKAGYSAIQSPPGPVSRRSIEMDELEAFQSHDGFPANLMLNDSGKAGAPLTLAPVTEAPNPRQRMNEQIGHTPGIRSRSSSDAPPVTIEMVLVGGGEIEISSSNNTGSRLAACADVGEGGTSSFQRVSSMPSLAALPEESRSSRSAISIPTPSPRCPANIPNSVGWTLQDPDLWANMTILIAAVFYCLYNCQVWLLNDYGTNHLYTFGDYFYFINAVFYLLASMRDNGVFKGVPELDFMYFITPTHLRQRLVAHDYLVEGADFKFH